MIEKTDKKGADLIRFRENLLGLYKIGKDYYALMKSKCKYLRGNKCKIYSRRPQICKDFPAGTTKEIWKVIHPDCGLV